MTEPVAPVAPAAPAPLQYMVQSKSSAGLGKVQVVLVQANDIGGNFHLGGSNFNLTLDQADADVYEINSIYAVSLTKV